MRKCYTLQRDFYGLLKDRPQYVLPHPLRNGYGRQGRPPHHGHHPRGYPLNKVQDSTEWEEVGDKPLIYANILRNIWRFQ